MITTFILLVLSMFTSFHIGRCVTTYKSYKKVFNRDHVETFFVGKDPTRVKSLQSKGTFKEYLLNNYVEIFVVLIGIVAIIVYFLTHII